MAIKVEELLLLCPRVRAKGYPGWLAGAPPSSISDEVSFSSAAFRSL